MNITILIPHFRTLKMTTYTVAQFLKYRGNHNVEIIVIDNSYPDDSIRGIGQFRDQITVINNTSDKISSHGVAYDMAMPHVKTDWFITAESDSFPTKENWIDYYENLIEKGFDCAGSLLKLSGGTFLHPCGALYRKSIWEQAKEYSDNIQYDYFPNMAVKEGFECHLMIKKSQVNRVLQNPEDYIELPKGYKGLSVDEMLAKRDYYLPICGVFHNGMGNLQESIKTFGERNTSTGVIDAVMDNKAPLIYRIGNEPGQFFCYWQLASGKHIALIPTEIKWLRNRGWQQQEYTINEAGFLHLWGVSAYHKANIEGMEDVISFKAKQVEDLYNSLPDNQKIIQ